MCALYVSFGSKLRPRTFGRVAIGSIVLFILRALRPLFSMNLMIVSEILVCISFLISVCMFIASKALLISPRATVIVRAGGAIWFNSFATVLFNVCISVTVEFCTVLCGCVVCLLLCKLLCKEEGSSLVSLQLLR